MAAVNVYAVRVLNNPAKFQDPFAFEIEYEALSNLQEDLVWKVIYVGSADGSQYDQELENVPLGPVTAGVFKFTLETNPPDPSRIPADDVLGVTVILLTCSYREHEFIRVGYYVNNEYLEEELRENPPEQPLFDRMHRSVLADHPRVTRFAISFDEPPPPASVPGHADVAMDGQDANMQDTGMEGAEAAVQSSSMQPEGGQQMHHHAYVPVM